MNWADLARGGATAQILEHWRKLGRFRHQHPAIGAGTHQRLQASPYVFGRVLESAGRTDRVVVALDQSQGAKTIPVGGVFPDGTEVLDAYSAVRATVRGGTVLLTTPFGVVLLGERQSSPASR
jgi:alpha-amylase